MKAVVRSLGACFVAGLAAAVMALVVGSNVGNLWVNGFCLLPYWPMLWLYDALGFPSPRVHSTGFMVVVPTLIWLGWTSVFVGIAIAARIARRIGPRP